MTQEPVYARRKRGYIVVNFPSVKYPQAFENVGDTVISLKKYLEWHRKNLPKTPIPEIDSELDERESGILENSLNCSKRLYEFRKAERL